MTGKIGNSAAVAMRTLAFAALVASAASSKGRALQAMAPMMSMAPAPGMMVPMTFMQPALPYPYSATEPFIDTRTNTIHFTKHLAAYYTNLNTAASTNSSLAMMKLDALVPALNMGTPKVIRNNAGGIINHLIFFKTLMMPTAMTNSTNNTMLPEDIAKAIDASFGNFTAFSKNMTDTAMGVFGSGWAWLTYNPKTKALAVEPTANQDSPLSSGLGYSGNTPLVGIDVWEHAYYLKHQNLRANYIKDWFMVVNWPQVSANYKSAMAGDLNSMIAYASA
ncbi:Superoxide dismutase [Mn] [Coccomyxa sp. Obi]|nr:Superoxide dismutase [Mn] [Coccomyxa sp. Obi]